MSLSLKGLTQSSLRGLRLRSQADAHRLILRECRLAARSMLLMLKNLQRDPLRLRNTCASFRLRLSRSRSAILLLLELFPFLQQVVAPLLLLLPVVTPLTWSNMKQGSCILKYALSNCSSRSISDSSNNEDPTPQIPKSKFLGFFSILQIKWAIVGCFLRPFNYPIGTLCTSLRKVSFKLIVLLETSLSTK